LVWIVLWDVGISLFRVGSSWMGIHRGNSVHRSLGGRRTGHAVADVAESGPDRAGEIAGRHQFAARVNRNGGPADIYTSIFGGHRTGCAIAFARRTLSGGFPSSLRKSAAGIFRGKEFGSDSKPGYREPSLNPATSPPRCRPPRSSCFSQITGIG